MTSILKKKLNKKGFTLAELLVVVAIIAILVAIAIPVFRAQLQKARAATDLANLRAGYAAAQMQLLTKDASTSTEVINAVNAALPGVTSKYGTGGYALVSTALDDKVLSIDEITFGGNDYDTLVAAAS